MSFLKTVHIVTKIDIKYMV